MALIDITSKRFPLYFGCLFSLVFLSACAGSSQAPVSSRQQHAQSKPVTETKSVTEKENTGRTATRKSLEKQDATQGFHIVKKGETLYSIAWGYGYDFRDVSDWNQIGAPYTIFPGQVIRLKPSLNVTNKSLQPGPVVAKKTNGEVKKNIKPEIKATATTEQKPVTKQTKAKKTRAASGKVVWQWPVKGKIIKSNLPTSKKGLDIGGKFGQDIKTAAAGDVVYSGSGLLGYGRLIIIKHNETYLSAYAHNSALLVQEGDEVVAGQKIAKMGKTSGGQVLLHFEIRKNGQSINPVGLLPKS